MRGDYSLLAKMPEARNKSRDNPQPLIVAALIEFLAATLSKLNNYIVTLAAQIPTGQY